MNIGASSSAALPAFGSAIFNFSSSKNSPQISAHVSVVFIENSLEDNESLDEHGQRKADSKMQEAKVPETNPEKVVKDPASDLEIVSKSKLDQRERTSEAEDTAPIVAEREAYSWCRVEEEQMDE